jgi:peptide methionine sulfoxide reductase msrA/msrB
VYSASGYDVTPLSEERVQELAAPLTEAQRRVILSKGTEAAFCGTLLDNHKEGTYVCALCGLPLFSSEAKFHSGTGWPSFFQPVDKAHVRELRDTSHGMVRTEIECARCGGHLGHVFEDGPPPTGLRYCMNSESLEFFEKGTQMPERSQPVKTETAYFAGGCFWGTEDRFAQVPGVVDVVSGYQGGSVEAPTYKQVCTGTTGHAETVRVTFDPARVSYHDLLEYFFVFHNPTQLNRQGPDVGTQYRSAIFAADEKQFKEAAAFVEEQRASERFQGKKIVTQVERAKPFYEAEAYHQDYHVKHGGSCPIPALD